MKEIDIKEAAYILYLIKTTKIRYKYIITIIYSK